MYHQLHLMIKTILWSICHFKGIDEVPIGNVFGYFHIRLLSQFLTEK